MRAVYVVASSFVLLSVFVATDGLPYSVDKVAVDTTGVSEDVFAGEAPIRLEGSQQQAYDTSLSQLQMDTNDVFIELEERAPPLTIAKQACTAAWAATKTQCDVIQTATVPVNGMLALKNAIKGAGEAVLNAVRDSLPSGNSTQVEAMRTHLKEKLDNLGETMGTADTESAPTQAALQKTLGHLACQALWQQVETLCTTVQNTAAQGKDAVTSTVQKEGEKFKARAETVAKTKMPDAAPSNSSNLMESQEGAEYQEDKFIHTIDSSDSQPAWV